MKMRHRGLHSNMYYPVNKTARVSCDNYRYLHADIYSKCIAESNNHYLVSYINRKNERVKKMGRKRKSKNLVDTSSFDELVDISRDEVKCDVEYFAVYINEVAYTKNYLTTSEEKANKIYERELESGVYINYIRTARVMFTEKSEDKKVNKVTII